MVAVIVCCYLAGVLLLTGIFAVAVVTQGGWQEVADRMSLFSGERISSLEMQWIAVLSILLWPITVPTSILMQRQRSR